MKHWVCEINDDVELYTDDFFGEIKAVCQRYNVSISHEDGHGCFVLAEYSDSNIDWLKSATIDSIEVAEQFKKPHYDHSEPVWDLVLVKDEPHIDPDIRGKVAKIHGENFGSREGISFKVTIDGVAYDLWSGDIEGQVVPFELPKY